MIALAIHSGHAVAQPDIYVDADATGNNDGSSWADAYTDFQSALDDATNQGHLESLEVWVAEGTYRGGFGTTLYGSAVYVYGGFDGTETSLANRAGLFSTTILSGDTGIIDDRDDNEDIVLSIGSYEYTGTFVLDGFVVEDADNYETGTIGGGINLQWGLLTVRNCHIRDNYSQGSGAGISVAITNQYIPTQLYVSNSVFENNVANVSGGGIYTTKDARVYNCEFIGNYASDAVASPRDPSQTVTAGPDLSHMTNPTGDGGAIAFKTSSFVRIVNCLFNDNVAGENGGAIYGWQQAPVIPQGPRADITSCTIVNSSVSSAAGDGIAVWMKGGSRISNSILWDNDGTNDPIYIDGTPLSDAVTYSNIENGFTGTGNIDSDPYFYDAANDDFRFGPGSPSYNAGNNSVIQADFFDYDNDTNQTENVPIDLGFEILGDRIFLSRVIDSTIDQGAYEACPGDSNMNREVEQGDQAAWISAYYADNYGIADVNNDEMLTPTDFSSWVGAQSISCD